MVVGVVLRGVETRGLQVQEQVPSKQEVGNVRKSRGILIYISFLPMKQDIGSYYFLLVFNPTLIALVDTP